ncbi:exodeoxyribonuclease V subunit beta [Rheinheimera riviphila]|uniref:RecBCD enzyme subunit RecB n=1 Tax=Rheinheimera riviphila TaxID=1834037 RepID=A0A437R300_9GAMM|nr:exodeoxyribonuclease V subunit beta [Rheinheimera riviphila]RVU41154.1 exodeoxyribonuclease V subunit beta [Rheinheimera riviphila]
MLKLDLLKLPLFGNALIEASAGTGKTYTIAALYLRAVLGHGAHAEACDEPHEASGRVPLLPPQILVVTFTEAATGELTERIRQRLSGAARYFRGELLEADPVLQQLAADYPIAQWPQCAMQLELAAQWMDEAAISTIHGWCNRMLSEHAFDSGSRFEEELSTDQSELMTQVVEDYWRCFVYPLSTEALLRWQRSFQNPALLQKALYAVWREQPLPVSNEPTVLINTEQQQRQQQLIALKTPWLAWVPELAVLIEQARSEKRLNGTKMRADYVQKWLDGILRFASDPAADSLDIGTGSFRLTPEGIADACKGEPLQHPAFAAMAALVKALEQLPDCTEDLRQHALAWCQLRFENTQRQLGCFGFDDMLDRLHQALKSERGAALAERIRSQFPLALIDEFQDTDPTQYGIFQQIYPLTTPRTDCGLLLIGDPKQAIYAFRGADIYTYLQAKQATAPRHYSLDTNFRSTKAMVETVNLLFLKAEQRDTGCGAFLFRQQQNLVQFEPVKAKGRDEQFTRNGEPLPALDLVYLDSSDKVLSKAGYFDAMAKHCAAQISQLLQEGQLQQTGFAKIAADGSSSFSPLQPADIAVLVNNQQEASAIRSALARVGVRSVYLSDRGSVFTTAIAHDLLLWLEACADPLHEQKVRSALASQSLGWSYAELARLQQDEWFFEHWLARFSHFSQLWQQQGVLPLVRQLLLEFQLVQTFAVQADGERQLTDLLHLAELLQQVSRTLEGELALLRYFKEHLAGEQQLDADQLKLRLESDEALVRVVTIHKSKGLEYPLVFLPFIAAARSLDPKQLPYRYHDEQQQLQLCYQPDEQIFAKAEFEQLGEDLRKLYVALTRSRHYCYLGLAALKERSAIGYLLSDSGLLEPTGLAARLALLQHPAAHPALLIRPWQSAESPTFASMPDPQLEIQPPLRSYATMPQRPRYQWWAASYSALAEGAGESKAVATQPLAPGGAWSGVDLVKNTELYQELKAERALQLGSDGLDRSAVASLTTNNSTIATDIYVVTAASEDFSQQYLRGAKAGTFLHDTLEWAAEQGFATVLAEPLLLQNYLLKHCQQQHWLWLDPTSKRWQRRLLVSDASDLNHFDTAEQAIEPLYQWLLVLLQSQWLCLDKATSLSSLALYKAELEFWFAASEVPTRAIDALLQQWLWPGEPRPALQPRTVNGMLKGFIDLTFEQDGRYHVLDYKSNFIESGHYSADNIRLIMLEKRYDLQAALYALALHRLLRSRLPDYDISQHLGSAWYWFVRGCPVEAVAETTSQGMLQLEIPSQLVLALDALFAGRTLKQLAEVE